MKSFIECYPCFVKQAIEAGSIATDDESVQWDILRTVLLKASSFSNTETPAAMGKEIHSIVRRLSKNLDPYKDIKVKYNQKAKELIPIIEKEINQSKDLMLTALKAIAIANIIDFGPFGLKSIDFNAFLTKKFSSEFCGNVDQFCKEVKSAKSVLYVADNCGEIIFDVFFINNFLSDKKVFLSLRGGAVLNDATKEDIKNVELNKNVEVIDNGDTAPGIILKNSNQEFCKTYEQVDLVILKGQGNYESIGAPEREHVYSILIAKCPVIARHIGCNINDLVLTRPGK